MELGYRVYVMNMHVSVCEGINKPLPTLLIIRNVNDTTLLNVIKKMHEPQNLCIITTQIDTVDKLDIRITIEKKYDKKHMSPVESPSCHNGFLLDLDDYKNQMESPSIFSVRVWLVTRDAMFLN